MYSREELKKAGLLSFPFFLSQVWKFLGLPSPTPVQKDIAKWLQNPGRRPNVSGDLVPVDRLVLSAFRGVGKTWITVAYVLWCLLLNPELKIMVVSANKQAADQFSEFAKQLIYGMPLLAHLAPRADQADRSDYFFVGPAGPSKDPSVKSVGINGQLTGSRADIIVFDDVEIPNNAQTFLLREKLAARVQEGAAILKPGGMIIYLGTPQVEESLYIKLVKDREYTMRVWPVELPEKPENYQGRLGPLIQEMMNQGLPAGTPVDPTRFDREELRKRKAEYGIAGFALQFMLDVNPAEADKRPLKLRNLIIDHVDDDLGCVKVVWSNDREHVIQNLPSGGFDGDFYCGPCFRSGERERYGGTVMAIDPSGMGSDETTYAIIRYLHGMLYLVEVGGFRDGFGEDTLKALADAAVRHKVNYVIDEENYGGGMFRQLLKPKLIAAFQAAQMSGGVFDEEYDGWSRGQKEARILDTLEPIVANHRLVVDRRVIEEDFKIQMGGSPFYSFVWQFTRMERTKGALPHEDRLEAVAMACAYWVSRMDRDRDRAVSMHRDKAMQAELRKYKRSALQVSKKRYSVTFRT